MFQDENDLAEARYRAESDALRNEYDLADTDADRKRIALQILDAEDAYLRAKLQAVVANNDLAKAVRDQAQIELNALNASYAARHEIVSRQNETEAERYMRNLDKSAEQVSEAIDGIKIDALDRLNDGLADAIVNFRSLGDVASSILKQILADLLRLQLQKTLIKPLAGLLGLGGGGSSSSGGGGSFFDSFMGVIDGARAAGGPVSAGKVYLTSEDGPELFQPGRSGRIISNKDLRQLGAGAMGMGGGIAQIVPSPYFDVVVDGRIVRASPAIMDGSAKVTTSRLGRRQTRRLA